MQAESFYNVATNLDELNKIKAGRRSLIDYYGGRSLHEQSHGESFLALALNRFSPQGLYLLDEPEAALSPTGQMTLLARIYALAREGAQFVIATHSPILTACPGADIYQLTGEGFARTPYRETENYRLTRAFLENPERMLRYLLAEEPGGDG
ncbi:MAG: AAA family ATPase [Anaerotruncus massiliensis (ex Togo et al. 2019)]